MWNSSCSLSQHVLMVYQMSLSSRRYFRPGRMAESEWTRSVRAVRDTLVADNSAPGINSTRRVPYRPQIAVSPYLFVLSVSCFKQSHWRCGQLWPYIGMGSLGVRSHQYYNLMGDSAKVSPRVPSTCLQNAILTTLIIHIIPSPQIYVAIDNPLLIPSVCCLTTSSYVWNDMCAADIVSQAESLESSGGWCFSQLYKFRDGIQVTRVFRYCGERQG